MTSPDAPSQSEAEAVIQKFLHDIEEFRSMPEKLEHAVNTGLRIIHFEWLQHKVRELWDKFKTLLNKLLDVLKEIVEGVFAPVTLYVHGHHWKDVKGDLSTVSYATDPKHLQATSPQNWQGDGAIAYNARATDESTLAGTFSTTADTVGNTLYKLAGGAVVFYIGIGAAIAALVAEYSAESGAAATGVGTPAAVGLFGVSTAKAVAFVTGLVVGFGALVKEELAAFSDLDGSLNQGVMRNGWFDPGAHAY